MSNKSGQNDLKKSIERLNAEHDRLDVKDVKYEEKRKALKKLISDLEYHLDNPKDKEHLEKVIKNIPEVINIFEVKHPGITDILNKVSMILSNMGI